MPERSESEESKTQQKSKAISSQIIMNNFFIKNFKVESGMRKNHSLQSEVRSEATRLRSDHSVEVVSQKPRIHQLKQQKMNLSLWNTYVYRI